MNQGSCSAAAIINFSDSCERGSIEHLNGEGSLICLVKSLVISEGEEGESLTQRYWRT